MGYLQCRNLVTWASNRYYKINDINTKQELSKFIPTYEVYGKHNLSKSYIVNKHRFDIKNKTIDKVEKGKYLQPSNIYDKDIVNGRLSKYFYIFNINSSKVFDFSGEEIDNFLK